MSSYSKILHDAIWDICFDTMTVHIDDTVIYSDSANHYKVIMWHIVPNDCHISLVTQDTCGNYAIFRGKQTDGNTAEICRIPFRGANINSFAKRLLENQGGNYGS